MKLYNDELQEHNRYWIELARKSGFVLTPLPPPPKRLSSTYEKDVDCFLQGIENIVNETSERKT